MPSINIGSNRFDNVAIPLVLDDRYFLLGEGSDGADVWTVFTFVDGQPLIEVLNNLPQQNSISVVETNPTGIITVSDPKTGKFLYKIRPGTKRSSIFGTIQGKETEIKVLDREIRVGTNVFTQNTIVGFPVGIAVRGGSIAIGSPLPPEFQRLIK